MFYCLISHLVVKTVKPDVFVALLLLLTLDDLFCLLFALVVLCLYAISCVSEEFVLFCLFVGTILFPLSSVLSIFLVNAMMLC